MQGGLIGRTARRLSHILMAPVQVVIRKAKRTLSPDSFASKVLTDVRKGVNQKKDKKERVIGDYFLYTHNVSPLRPDFRNINRIKCIYSVNT